MTIGLGLTSALAAASPAVATAFARSNAKPAVPTRSPEDEKALHKLFVDAYHARPLPAVTALKSHAYAFRGSAQRTDLAHQGGKTLFIDKYGRYKVARGEKEWDLEVDTDLEPFGIRNVGHVQQLLVHELREVVGTDATAHADEHKLIEIVNAKSQAARSHIAALTDRADAKLLRDYQYTVLRPQRDGSRSDCWTELLTGDDSLKISYHGGLVASSGGPDRTVGLYDLERLRVSTPHQFDAMLAKQVIAAAGLKGNEANALERARAQLKAQIDHAR